MDDDLRILLVSPDLMATSRLAALGREHGARLETLRSVEATPRDCACDVVLLDLQSTPGDPAVIVSRLRSLLPADGAAGPPPLLVAFGPHVARQRLDDALAAGADEVLSRGELLGSFPALVRRWRG
jgi:CheY-like chemotaxis protein